MYFMELRLYPTVYNFDQWKRIELVWIINAWRNILKKEIKAKKELYEMENLQMT